MTTLAGVVLAAGEGSRFGGPKALAGLGGTSLLRRALQALTDGGCRPCLVVVGAHPDVAVEAVAAGAEVVACPDWAEGMSASLRAGLRAVPPDAAGAVVVLADQPLLAAAAVRRVAAAVAGGADAARATYGGKPGHPVAFAAAVLTEVAAGATGDAGARDWLRAHPAQVAPVPCDDLGDPVDVDTRADLAALDAPGDPPAR